MGGRADRDHPPGSNHQSTSSDTAENMPETIKAPAGWRVILFLCTGNYYRSRFAEEVFNYHAEREGLTWVAQSRALAIGRGKNNFGPISPFVLQALDERGLVAQGANSLPQQCALADLNAADRIVALMETEHRPLILQRFPGWENRVDYWDVADIEITPPVAALKRIENRVMDLLRLLGAGPTDILNKAS
jgi:protein-tyrosine phosphatase